MRIGNRQARRDYLLSEKFEAGVALAGDEVKSIRAGHLRLEGAFVRLKNGEAWLVNAHIAPYSHAAGEVSSPYRERKLLLHKRELLNLSIKTAQKGLTIVPVSCYTKGGKIKLEIALAKGKREYEKREAIKKREQEKELRNL